MKNNKTIGITLRFFTDNLPKKVGNKDCMTPCWSNGNAFLEANKEKGIKSQRAMFHYLDDIPRVIRQLMKDGKIAYVEDVGMVENAKKRNK